MHGDQTTTAPDGFQNFEADFTAALVEAMASGWTWNGQVVMTLPGGDDTPQNRQEGA